MKKVKINSLFSKLMNPKNLFLILMICVLGISIASSAVSAPLNIAGLVTKVRLKSDIRITGIESSSIENLGESTYLEYNKANISAGVLLPNADSSVTYKVEITNIGNVEMGIFSLENLPENLDYEVQHDDGTGTLVDYNINNKICNSNNVCKLGIKKDIYITIKYKEGIYETLDINTVEDCTYHINVEFNFQPFYSVTYIDIEGGDYPIEILGNNTLEVNFGENAQKHILVKVDGVEVTDYEYSNKILTLPNVEGNVTIIKDTSKNELGAYIANLYSPTTTVQNNNITYNLDETNGLMNDRLGGVTTDYDAGNIRYYGPTPNNYIDIGDRDTEGNIILWRIVGLFKNVVLPDGTKEDLVKIIRADELVKYMYDNKPNGVGSSVHESFGSNDWTDARLMMLLNPGYEQYSGTDIYEYETGLYWNSGSGTCYGLYGEAVECDFTSKGLSDSAKEKVQTVVWNLGGWNSNSVYSNEIYKYERGTTVFANRATKWTGNIALMYPSDYGYATDFTLCSNRLNQYAYGTETNICGTSNWLFTELYQYTLTPNSDNSHNVYHISSPGYVTYSYDILNADGTLPVFYLRSDLELINGTGEYNDTVQDPYVVELPSAN